MNNKNIVLALIFGIIYPSISFAQNWLTPDNYSIILGKSLTYRESISLTSINATTLQIGLEWEQPISKKIDFSVRLSPGFQAPAYEFGETKRFFMEFNMVGHYSLSSRFKVGIGLSTWRNFYNKSGDILGWELETKKKFRIGYTLDAIYRLTERLSTGFAVIQFPRVYALTIENQLENYTAFKNTSMQFSVFYNFLK